MPAPVFAVFVSYNPSASFVMNVQSIIDQGARVIIVDNGSDPVALAQVKIFSNHARAVLILNNTNLGIAAALNQGVKLAVAQGAEMLFTFDQDSHVSNSFVTSMLNAWNELGTQGKRLACVGPSWINSSTDRLDGSHASPKGYAFPDYIISSGMLINKRVFDEVGFFLETYFIDYVDVEFCLRCKGYGLEVAQCLNIRMTHSLGKSQLYDGFGGQFQSTNHNYLRRYYITRNRILTWRKYARSYSSWFRSDLRAFFAEALKIILVEHDRSRKLKSILLGISDAVWGRTGKYGGASSL